MKYNQTAACFMFVEPEANEDKYLGSERERLALHVLNSFQSMVPEHVETRELMSSLHPGFPQVQYRRRIHNELAASHKFYQLVATCQQVAANLIVNFIQGVLQLVTCRLVATCSKPVNKKF